MRLCVCAAERMCALGCVSVSRGRRVCVGECNGNVTIPLVTLSSSLCARRSNVFRVVFRYCKANRATKFLCLMRVRVHICHTFVGERTNNGSLAIQEHTHIHECDPYILGTFQLFDKEVCVSSKKFFGSTARCVYVWVVPLNRLFITIIFRADVRVYASRIIYPTEKYYLFEILYPFCFKREMSLLTQYGQNQIFNNQNNFTWRMMCDSRISLHS